MGDRTARLLTVLALTTILVVAAVAIAGTGTVAAQETTTVDKDEGLIAPANATEAEQDDQVVTFRLNESFDGEIGTGDPEEKINITYAGTGSPINDPLNDDDIEIQVVNITEQCHPSER